jgi:hypothetical protein
MRRELVLDGADDGFGRAIRVAAREPVEGELAQVGGRRLAGRHQLLGVFVADLVERERAAARDFERADEEVRGMDLREPSDRSQVPLAVGMEACAPLRTTGT